jgi:large subunit ribosomal protein L18
MATRGKVRIIAHRRRREGRTDYRHRLAMVKSGKPRFVVRRSVNSMTCQLIRHDPKGDKSLVTVSSKSLAPFGWKGSIGNLPAAYLTGFLCGTMAKEKGLKEAVLDMGLHASTKGSRIYSALKGVIDAGVNIPHSEDILPPIERIRGLHIEKHAESRGKKASVSAVFDEVKKRIESGAKPKPAAGKPASKKPAAKKSPEKPKPAKGK